MLGTDIKVKNIRSKQAQMMAGFGGVGGKGSDAGQGNGANVGGGGGGGVGVEGGGFWSSTSLGALVIGFSIVAVVVGRKRSGIRRSDSRGVCVWVRLGFSLSLPPIMPRVYVCVCPTLPPSHPPTNPLGSQICNQWFSRVSFFSTYSAHVLLECVLYRRYSLISMVMPRGSYYAQAPHVTFPFSPPTPLLFRSCRPNRAEGFRGRSPS